MDLQALGLRHCPGGGDGAEEVTGIHRVQGHIRETLCQRRQLAVAVVGDEAVILAVDAPVEVPLGLGGSDEVNFGHTGSSEILKKYFRPGRLHGTSSL